MKKLLISAFMLTLSTTIVMADNVFDSMDKATEVRLAPAIKEQKFNSALVNLDDAQVELRQELATVTAKYNEAVIEKNKMVAHCKSLKNEIKDINKKMKNVDKSKKIINKNLQTTAK